MGNGKVCQRCGAALEGKQVKWCKPCFREIKRERDRLNWEKQRPKPRTLICPWCGVEFVTVHGNRKYCDVCMNIDKKSEKTPPKDALKPLADVRTTIPEREIQRLAKLYGPPYETYGKMKAYLETMRKLPPESCLRSAHPNVADTGAFQPTPGERWF